MAFLQSMIHFTVNNSIRHVSTTAQNSTGCCTVVSQLCERKVDEKNQTDELSHWDVIESVHSAIFTANIRTVMYDLHFDVRLCIYRTSSCSCRRRRNLSIISRRKLLWADVTQVCDNAFGNDHIHFVSKNTTFIMTFWTYDWRLHWQSSVVDWTHLFQKSYPHILIWHLCWHLQTSVVL